MNCPSCGAHVPRQRRIWPKRKATYRSRLYKRVFMRAKRLGVSLPVYVRTHVALYRDGRVHDKDALEITPRGLRSAAPMAEGRRVFAVAAS